MRLTSTIVPAYNESGVLPALVQRVPAAFAAIKQPLELELVNDGPTDDTLAEMLALAAEHPEITVVNLSCNLEKEIATTAGLAHTVGDTELIYGASLHNSRG